MRRSPDRTFVMFAGSLLGLAALLPFGACRSVYDSAKGQLRTDLHERLSARVQSARDAATAGLAALEPSPSAQEAEEAGWDLDKAAASIGDVLDRMPERDRRAMAIQLAMERAAGSLTAAADALASPSAPAADSVDHAQRTLHAAIDLADEYLEGAQGAP